MRHLIKREEMNYFKGSGSCGINTSPNKKNKENLKKSVLNQNVLIQKSMTNSEIRLAGKA